MKNLVVLSALVIAFSSCATKKEQAKVVNKDRVYTRVSLPGTVKTYVVETDSTGNLILPKNVIYLREGEPQSSSQAPSPRAQTLEDRDKQLRTEDTRSSSSARDRGRDD